MATDTFISYARRDQEFVDILKPTLRRICIEKNLKHFLDTENIMPGENWKRRIDDALINSNIIVCLLSNSFFASEFIQKNELPLIEMANECSKTVLCILIESTPITPNSFLSRVQWVNDIHSPLSNMDQKKRDDFLERFYEVMLNKISTIGFHPPYIQKKVRYNIVVVGKTGVGKSQLINYLLDEELLKTGIGKPVTKLGFHRIDLPISGINTSIYDSAGLEIGNFEEWMKYLHEELGQRALTAHVSKWFHTVLYCVAGTGSRIEPFEIEIINQFLAEHYKVIVVITKAYIGKKKLDELCKKIHSDIQQDLTCVHVNSTDEEIGDTVVTVVRSFGKVELMQQIKDTLIYSLTDRIAPRCIKFMEEYLDIKLSELIQYIRENSGTKKEMADHIRESLKNLNNDVTSPNGHFRNIIVRETKLTLAFYNEILNMVETRISNAEVTDIANASTPPAVRLVRPLWQRFFNNADLVFDSLNLQKYLGEIVGILLVSVVATPVAIVGAIIGYSIDHWNWREDVIKMVKNHVSELKAQLPKSEAAIRSLFSDKGR